MSEIISGEEDITRGWRFRLGMFFFILGWICPLFIPVVTTADIEAETKTLLSGLLLVGAPELFSFISIIILGKAGFNLLKQKAFALLRRAAPSAQVSRFRYRVGLFMIMLHVINAQFIFYAPDMIPGYMEHRLTINLTADLLFVVTLFVLGGDFWEKLRALVLYDAKVTIPPASNAIE